MVESRGYAQRLSAELKEAKDLIARLKRLQKLVHEVRHINRPKLVFFRSGNIKTEQMDLA